MSSYDSGARQLWRHANQDRSLAQAAFEALGGVGALPRFLPDVWDAFSALGGGGGLPDLPDDVTALEPTGLADSGGDLTAWTPTRNGGTTAVVAPNTGTPQVTTGASGAAWVFFEDFETTTFDRLTLTESDDVDAVEVTDDDLWVTEAGGVMLIGAWDVTSVVQDQTFWTTVDGGGAENLLLWDDGGGGGNNLTLTRAADSANATDTALVELSDVAAVLHIAFGDTGQGLNGWQANALIDAPPPTIIDTGSGYLDGFQIGPIVGEIHGCYVYTGGPSKAGELWRYVLSRFTPVLGGG